MKGTTMINERVQNNVVSQDQSGLAPQGMTPPRTSPIKFVSEEEKKRAEKAVMNGTYSSLEEYVKWRDTPENYGYAAPNSTPDFTKR